jgi:hypothetical protein
MKVLKAGGEQAARVEDVGHSNPSMSQPEIFGAFA